MKRVALIPRHRVRIAGRRMTLDVYLEKEDHSQMFMLYYPGTDDEIENDVDMTSEAMDALFDHADEHGLWVEVKA